MSLLDTISTMINYGGELKAPSGDVKLTLYDAIKLKKFYNGKDFVDVKHGFPSLEKAKNEVEEVLVLESRVKQMTSDLYDFEPSEIQTEGTKMNLKKDINGLEVDYDFTLGLMVNDNGKQDPFFFPKPTIDDSRLFDRTYVEPLEQSLKRYSELTERMGKIYTNLVSDLDVDNWTEASGLYSYLSQDRVSTEAYLAMIPFGSPGTSASDS